MGVSLDKILQSLGRHGRWSSYTPAPAEQQERLNALRPPLEKLHGKLPVDKSAAIAQLAYFWAHQAIQHRISAVQSGLEFLAQQVQEDEATVLDYLSLREPWKRLMKERWEPWSQRPNKRDAYVDFMLNVLEGLQLLEPQVRERYLGLIRFAVDANIEAGVPFANSAATGIKSFGVDTVKQYARPTFEWLKRQWPEKEIRIGIGSHKIVSEVLFAMWYFLQEYKGDEAGVAKLAEHLGVLEEVVPSAGGIYFGIVADNLTSQTFSPAARAEVWKQLAEVDRKAERYDSHTRYLLWEMLAKLSGQEQSAGIFTNYIPAVFTALDRAGGKADGIAAQLLDKRHAAVIAERIDRLEFWQSLSKMTNEVGVITPGGWVPDTQAGAASLLDAVKGANFVAEKELLIASIDDIAERTPYGPILNVLDLGVGNGEKLATMLKAFGQTLAQVNACIVDANFFIAFAGAEELIRSLKFSDGELYFGDRSVSLQGKMWTQKEGTPINITAIVEYFERLNQHPAHQEFVRKHPDYLLTCLGTTICNFEPETAMGLLHDLAYKYALISLYLYDGNDAKLIQDYDTPENLRMGQHHLLQQGVLEEDFDKLEHVAEVRKRKELVDQTDLGVLTRLVTYFKVKPGQRVQGTFHEFREGDVINVGLSIKYSDVQAKALFKQFGFDVAQGYYSGNVGVYLIERCREAEAPEVSVPGR